MNLRIFLRYVISPKLALNQFTNAKQTKWYDCKISRLKRLITGRKI